MRKLQYAGNVIAFLGAVVVLTPLIIYWTIFDKDGE